MGARRGAALGGAAGGGCGRHRPPAESHHESPAQSCSRRYGTPAALAGRRTGSGTSAPRRWRIGAAPAVRDRFGALCVGVGWRRSSAAATAVPVSGLSSGTMSRIVSVWLKAWPIARLLRAQSSAAPADAIDPHQAACSVAPGKGGARIVRSNRAAQEAGLVGGDLLSNARSKVLELQSRDADPAADAAALKLALWALRYTPIVAAWDEASGGDGLFLDIAGCAHLFGGEEPLLADLARRLRALAWRRAGRCRHGGPAWAARALR